MNPDVPGASLFAAIHQPAFLHGPDGRIVAANALAEALAGRALAGSSPADVIHVFDHRHPDGTPLAPAELPALRALAGEEVVDVPFTVMASDGRTQHVLATATPIRDGDAIIGALATWQDVTGGQRLREEFAESEAKYRNLVELSPDAILIHQDGTIVFANPAAVALIGARGPDDLVGRPVLEIVHPDQREPVEWNIAADLRQEESPLTMVDLLRPDGTTVTVQGRGAMIPFHGRPAVQVVLRDVTDQKRAEDEVRRSAKRREFLLALGDRLREAANVGEVTRVASELLGRLLGADGVVYCEVDPDAEHATVRADWNDGTVPTTVGRFRMDDFGIGDLYRRGLIRRTEDVTTALDGREADEHAALAIRASLGVPVCRGGRLAAVMAVHSAQPRAWTDVEVELVRQTGDRVWASVERARAEEALREGEKRLRLAQESAQIGIWDRDVATDTVTISPEFLRHYGLEEIAVSSYADLVQLMHPDDRGLVEAGRSTVLTAGEPLNLELRVRIPSGEFRWIQFKGRGVTDRQGVLVRVIGLLIDVTDRKRIEDALRDSEERLRDVLELSLDAVYRRDLVADRYDYISPVNEALTGFTAEEFGALSLEEFVDRIHPEDQPKAKMIIAEAMRGTCTKTSGTIEYRFRCRDGSWRWLSDHFTFELDADGRLHYRVGVVRDVTRRRGIEAALRESEERLRLAQESARIGIWDWEAATNRVTISPHFLRMYGLEARAVSSYADLERMIHPDDLMQVWTAQLAVLASGAPMDLELRILLPSGEVRWVQFKGQGITDEQGALARVIGVLIDVTDRKRAEAALAESEADARSFFVNMVDACAICETVFNDRGEPTDVRLVDVNPAFARALSLPAELIVGQTAFMILPALAREWFDLFLKVSRDRSFIEVEEPFPALDRWYHVTAFPVRHGRVAVVFRDITERREAEDERVRFTEDLQRSNEELQRFAYVASHDLQEPLRSIISFSQLLERRYKGRLDQDADEYIAFIIEGGNRMHRLIADLLQLSRVETTAKPLEPTDAGEVVDGVLRAMETPIREAGATVEVEPLPTVMADAAQLAQVFTNLIGNAVKYRRPDVPPVIRISAGRTGRVWRFAVADNGIGIEPEYYGRIFVIFQRLHTKEEYDGTGIGLAVVKKIIDRHGGRVWVESTPGQGSTFLFTLPAA